MIDKFFVSLYSLFIDMSFYLVIGLIFVGILHVLLKKDWAAKWVGKNNTASVVKASLFGVPLPLCSCGVIPTAVFLNNSGASLGAVIAFLISTPQTGVDSIIATYGMLGVVFALYRPIAAFISGIIGGVFIGKVAKKKDGAINNDALSECQTCNTDSCLDSSEKDCSDHSHKEEYKMDTSIEQKNRGVLYSIKRMLNYAFIEFLDDISGHFIIGLLISALITVLIPDDWFGSLGINKGLPAMLIMMVIGIPMYICSTSSIPVAVTLMMKGFSPGAAFVFLFTGPVTNAASVAVLTKTLAKKVTALYIAVVSVMAIAFGYLLDFIIKVFSLSEVQYMKHHVHSTDKNIFELIVATIFFVFIARSIIMKVVRKYSSRKTNMQDGTKGKGEVIMNESNKLIVHIEGMSCKHCSNTVMVEISKITGVKDVQVLLETKKAIVTGEKLNKQEIKEAVNNAGYSVTSIED